MRLHVAALFTFDKTERLEAVNDSGGAPAPRFFLGRTAEGDQCWFRHDVPDETVADIQAILRDQATTPGQVTAIDPTPFIERLSRDGRVLRTWMGPAFTFPENVPDAPHTVLVTAENADLLAPYLENWRSDVAGGAPMAVALDNGQAVSICASARVTARAHEAGVETHPDFRRRGHAGRAVMAWARAVRSLGVVPLYSTSWDNAASLGLAKSLGLIPFGVDLHIL
ncbi:MAG TPA: GNAT family N-acetyltransferase [Gemmatimonadaceae bacterium]